MKHFDLFSGYGGFSIACENNGIKTVGFSEIDKYASAVLKYHWPKVKNYGDISKINTEELPDFDLLTGGSPCQDLSIAGKRRGLAGQRSGLFMEYIRILNAKKPQYFIWENVKGALSSNYGFDFAVVLNEFSKAGYSLWWQVLNAKDFGVPQNRERIFIIGFRDGSPREVFFERKDCQKDNVIPTITARYYEGQANGAYIGNKAKLKELTKNQSQGYRVYDTDGISVNIASQAGGLGAKTGLYAFPTNTKRGVAYGEEGDGINLSFPKSKTRRGRVIKKVSPTCQCNNSIGTLQNSKIRRLTPRECERLMGLPDDWTAKGIINDKEIEISDSQRYKLCGNGVVVNVVEILLKEIIACG